MTMHQQKKDTITEMQVTEESLKDQVLQLSKQAKEDANGLSDCWKKICVKGGAADNYEMMSWFWDEMWTWKLGTHF